MRITVFLCLLSIVQVFALPSVGQGTKLNLRMKNSSLEQVLENIEENSNYLFFYQSNDLTGKNSIGVDVDVDVEQKTVFEILDEVLPTLELTYEVFDKYIAIKAANENPNAGKIGQQKSVSGKVTDSSGAPLPGVTVIIKGTTQGTITDINGDYSVSDVASDATLIFSFIGMVSQEIPVVGKSSINVVMAEESIGLEEVVAVGYATQIRKNLSSSISKVDAEKIMSSAAPSFESGLEGRAAGVQVTTSSAMAGSAIKIRVRGTSSASANSEPLYVIDGVPVESGAISNSAPGASVGEWNLQTAANTNVLASLNPADIESLEVLKDAAAAAIYGSRGANGVVLITTKKGKVGKTQINASATFGLSDATHRITLLNSEQYIKMAQEAWYNSGNNIADFWTKSGVLVDGLTKEQAMNTNTDWIDETLQIGNVQDYNVSVSGGNDKTVFFISANLKDEESILRGNEYKRFGTRLNVEHQISERFRLGSKLMLSHVDDKQVPTAWAGGVGSVSTMLPIWPVHKEDGSYFRLNDLHPVAGVDLREINLKSDQVLGNWFLKARIIDGLTFRTEFGANLLFNDDFHYRDGRITTHGRTVSSTVIGKRSSWNWKNIANYTKKLGQHKFDLLGAIDVQEFNAKTNTMFGDTFFNSALKKPSDAAIKNATYFETGYSFVSYIGRLNYDYKGRYLLSMSLRADGSSRFAEDNRWGYFPAGSFGYIMSEEKFFKPLEEVINFMKLRISYGIVGNAEIGDYSYVTSYGSSSYNGNTGIVLTNLGDDKLGWEQTSQLDLGITWEMFDGKISAEFDYYDKRTSDLLLPYPVSLMTGVSNVTKNVGELSNKGFEFMLNTINYKKNDFSWETNITLARNINKVEKLSDELGEGLSSQQGLATLSLFKGYPVGVTEMSEWGGVDPLTGEDTYIDKAGNKLLYSEIVSSYGNFTAFHNENKKPMGNPWPEITGGIDNRFTWKNWYANVLFTFATGMDYIYLDQSRMLSPFGSTKINPTTNILDRWRVPGDVTDVSQATAENINWSTTSEYLHDTDYLRLKDLTIGYRFKMKKNFIKSVNCYLKFTNLLTFTKAPDFYWDPEFSGVVQNRSDNNLNAGSNFTAAPQAKMYMLGVSVDF